MKCCSVRTRRQSDRLAGAWMATLAGLALAPLVLAGCASMHGASRTLAVDPEGPGASFSTIESAAVDAMAYSLLEGRRTGRSDRLWGGAITMTADGYTYSEPVVAPSYSPSRIRYPVTSNDVARFHVYPKGVNTEDRHRREHVSRSDRASVDSLDPRRRPVYFLTPRLVVKAYYGKSVPEQEVARLDRASDTMLVVVNDAPVH